MTITTEQPSMAQISCPPGCKHAADPATHEIHGGFVLSEAYVQHETDFGPYAFGNVYQYLDGSTRTAKVTVGDLEARELTPPACALSSPTWASPSTGWRRSSPKRGEPPRVSGPRAAPASITRPTPACLACSVATSSTTGPA